jgi:hypothetical protein
MTAVSVRRPDAVATRTMPAVLAHTHLRLGLFALARTELETLAELGQLDPLGLVDLAEVRWRTGDLAGAGEAAVLAMRGDVEFPVALVIASEAAAALGRPTEARRLASRAMATATGSIDVIFAGMHRSAAWPSDSDEPPPTAPTLFDRPADPPAPTEQNGSPTNVGVPTPPTASAPASGPMTLGLWDDGLTEDPAARDAPDAALELEAGRAALVDGAFDQAALRFAIALRFAPALAPAVLEATAGARAPSVSIVRGDAYRLAGHEMEAREAYLVAANGGLPERRRRVRVKAAKAGTASTDSDIAPLDDVGPDTEALTAEETQPEAIETPGIEADVEADGALITEGAEATDTAAETTDTAAEAADPPAETPDEPPA